MGGGVKGWLLRLTEEQMEAQELESLVEWVIGQRIYAS